MNEISATNETHTLPGTYLIGEQRYRLEPASYRQHRWLAEGPLKGVDFSDGLSHVEIQSLLTDHAPEILGIVLIPEGQTREEKVRAGLPAARALAERIECTLTPEEVRPIAEDFFVCNGFKNWAFFVDFRKVAGSMPAAGTETGSTPPSVSLLVAISRSETPSNAAPDRETAKPICVGSLNGSSPI